MNYGIFRFLQRGFKTHGRARRQKKAPALPEHCTTRAKPHLRSFNLQVGNIEHQDAQVWSRAHLLRSTRTVSSRAGGRGRGGARPAARRGVPRFVLQRRCQAHQGHVRGRIKKAWGHTHRGWRRLLDCARDLITHGPAHRFANGAAMPTDEDDQDGQFFYNHPGPREGSPTGPHVERFSNEIDQKPPLFRFPDGPMTRLARLVLCVLSSSTTQLTTRQTSRPTSRARSAVRWLSRTAWPCSVHQAGHFFFNRAALWNKESTPPEWNSGMASGFTSFAALDSK